MSDQIRVEDINGKVVLARGGGPVYGRMRTADGLWADVQLADRWYTCPSFQLYLFSGPASRSLGWSSFLGREGGEASWVKSPDHDTFPAAWRPTGSRGA